MNPDDVYQQWKQQGALIKAPDGLEANVMATVNQPGVDQTTVEPPAVTASSAPLLLDHPAWATAAVLAASLMGLMRVAFALLIGIS